MPDDSFFFISPGLTFFAFVVLSNCFHVFFVEGVNLGNETCSLGQQFRHPRDAILYDGVDILIVGRGIYNKGQQVLGEAEKYRQAGWAAYIETQHL